MVTDLSAQTAALVRLKMLQCERASRTKINDEGQKCSEGLPYEEGCTRLSSCRIEVSHTHGDEPLRDAS